MLSNRFYFSLHKIFSSINVAVQLDIKTSFLAPLIGQTDLSECYTSLHRVYPGFDLDQLYEQS